MSQKNLSFTELLDLIVLEDSRGIISKEAFIETALQKGIPKIISDARGAVRLTVERVGEDFSVTQYPTELANESINRV